MFGFQQVWFGVVEKSGVLELEMPPGVIGKLGCVLILNYYSS